MTDRRQGALMVCVRIGLVIGCITALVAHTARASSSTPAVQLRWLVPTTGSPPTIAAENAQPGTLGWRLRGPSADIGGLAHGSIHAYVAKDAVLPGGEESIYVSSPGIRHVTIQIFRMGWYHGDGGREIAVAQTVPSRSQHSCVRMRRTGLSQCAWKPTLTFTVPSALPSGVYVAKITGQANGNGSRSGSDILFVVRSAQPQPILVQLPTSTYQAYNGWGGDSLYQGGNRVKLTGHSGQAVEVSYQRPYEDWATNGAGEFFQRDVAMIEFLERYGYPVSYTTSDSVGSDPAQAFGHRALIDIGHSEYWSASQRSAFKTALGKGTSLLFLGSDTMAWHVRYVSASSRSSNPGEPGQTIVAYKQYVAKDPHRTHRSGLWRDGGSSLTGSSYVGCITPRVRKRGFPAYRYFGWSPSPSLRPHWLYKHTGVTRKTVIRGIVGYELDRTTAFTPKGTRVIGSGTATCMGKAEPGAPRFKGPLGLAQTTLYTARSGAIVFNTGTLGWELGLEPVPSASPHAPSAPERRLVAMTRNLIAHVLATPGGISPKP